MSKIKKVTVWNINTDEVLLLAEVGECFVENIETSIDTIWTKTTCKIKFSNGVTEVYTYPSDKVYNCITKEG